MDTLPRIKYETICVAENKAVVKSMKVGYITTSIKVICLVIVLASLVFLLREEQHKAQILSESSAGEGPGYEPSVQRDSSGSGRAGEQKQSREQADDDFLVLWGEWGAWSSCSRRTYCHEGTQARSRTCISLDETANCVGVSSESRDCPDSGCRRRTHALADEVEVATSSFIAQECNVTEKYSAMGKYSDELLDVVYRRFPAAKRMLQSGFYAIQEIPRIIDKETDIIKICFEPQGSWSLSGCRKAFRLNRSTRASLGIRHKSTNVVGITVGLYPDDALYGVALATGTSAGWYDKIYYRRWRGQGFPGNFLF